MLETDNYVCFAMHVACTTTILLTSTSYLNISHSYLMGTVEEDIFISNLRQRATEKYYCCNNNF